MERDREKTKMIILQTLGKMVAERGFKSIGINAIAREAEVEGLSYFEYLRLLAKRRKDAGPDG